MLVNSREQEILSQLLSVTISAEVYFRVDSKHSSNTALII